MITWEIFLPAAAAMAMVPGANQVLGLRNAATHGVRYAVVGLAGRLLGFSLLLTVVAVGLGRVLERSVLAFEILRWAGVAYLVWLGVTTFLHAGRGSLGETAGGRPVVAARRELLTAVTNPKAMLVFASFLPQFVPSGGTTGTLVTLSLAYIALEGVAAFVYIAGGTVLRAGGELSVRAMRRIDRTTGAVLVALGASLAVTGRHGASAA